MEDTVQRFGPFEFDARRQELRKDGRPLHLHPQPAQLLTLLLRRAGEVVSREEIRRELWGDETFVDFDLGINSCIRQLRGMLSDDAEHPRFIETVPRQGYRFLTPGPTATPEASSSIVLSESTPAVGWWKWVVVAGLAAGLGALAVAVSPEANRDAGSRVARFEIETGPLEVLTPPVAISRDGATIAYVRSGREIYVRQLNQEQAFVVPNTEGAFGPAFSPNGEWVAFFHVSGKVKKVPVGGGSAVNLADFARGAAGGIDWASDDEIFFADSDGTYRVSANGGERERLETVRGPDTDRSVLKFPRGPRVLPGARAVLLTVGDYPRGRSVAIQEMATGRRWVLLESAQDASYVPTGHLVFGRNNALYAIRFDLDKLAVEGEPVPVIEDIHINVNNGTTQYTFSDDGTLCYVPIDWSGFKRRLVWIDLEGNVERTRSIPRRIAGPAISPDGRNVALTIYEGIRPGIWLIEDTRETLSPLFPGRWAYAPRWSPDGRQLAFVGTDEEERILFTKSMQSSAEPERIGPGIHVVSWSPTANVMAHMTFEENTKFNVWTTSLEESHETKALLNGTYMEGTPAVSPDGNWLAYVSNASGRGQVYAMLFDGTGESHQVSTNNGYEPLWSPDGSEIYYTEENRASGRLVRKMMAVDVQTEPAFEASPPRLLFEGEYLRNDLHRWIRNHDLSPDGQRFLMIESEKEALPATKVKFVLNWFSELERLVPTR